MLFLPGPEGVSPLVEVLGVTETELVVGVVAGAAVEVEGTWSAMALSRAASRSAKEASSLREVDGGADEWGGGAPSPEDEEVDMIE